MESICLVHLFHPGQFLPAACSVAQAAKLSGRNFHPRQIRLLCSNIILPHSCHENLIDTLTAMTDALGWGKIIHIDNSSMEMVISTLRNESSHNNTSHSLKEKDLKIDKTPLRKLMERLIGFEISEFHYAHNILGTIAEAIMRAYPEANHYTYGDAFGTIYNKGFHIALASGRPLEEAIEKGKIFADNPDILDSTDACLIMPVDQTGDILEKKGCMWFPNREYNRYIPISCRT
ncbi:hypothetical protein MTBBW1_2560013 [Desulfamplus magnetovallimortis]|uniref:Uncharacterized protein n=1 Tax=Desulfamplus magnetovallimortis TaxID=1246637 RepID=A0A1W1HF17_9BACT|nr:hypothetical protein [Desulfamplus magnetovallimortis]SLM30972.1 hypothetical protein MTBBW1_2560013 [Desulfamplus magnetovallimortis]